MVAEEKGEEYLSSEIQICTRDRERFIKQAEKLRRNLKLRKKQLAEREKIITPKEKSGAS